MEVHPHCGMDQDLIPFLWMNNNACTIYQQWLLSLRGSSVKGQARFSGPHVPGIIWATLSWRAAFSICGFWKEGAFGKSAPRCAGPGSGSPRPRLAPPAGRCRRDLWVRKGRDDGGARGRGAWPLSPCFPLSSPLAPRARGSSFLSAWVRVASVRLVVCHPSFSGALADSERQMLSRVGLHLTVLRAHSPLALRPSVCASDCPALLHSCFLPALAPGVIVVPRAHKHTHPPE